MTKLDKYDDEWIKMADNRTYTAYMYNEPLAEKIYQGLPRAPELFKQLAEVLKEK